jgi:hypothetical protein
MAKRKQDLKNDLMKLWNASQKEFNNLTRETSKILKKGEKHLQKVTAESQKKMELINATITREKLYYQLGKTLGPKSQTSWINSKKAGSLSKQIKKFSSEIKRLS